MKRASRQASVLRRSPANRAVPADERTGPVREFHATLNRLVPRRAIVLVASKGDPALVRSRRCVAWHFPRNAEGQYAGYHPACSLSAVAQLEALRAQGAAYLAFPSTSLWWLDHYSGLSRHLAENYRLLSNLADSHRVYALFEQPDAGDAQPGALLRAIITEFQDRFGRPPCLLDWDSGLELAKRFPRISVFSPTTTAETLPYLQKSVDLVAYRPISPTRPAEANHLAGAATICCSPPLNQPEVRWLTRRRPHRRPTVSLIIPCHNQWQLTEACLRSLFATLPSNWRGQVLVVDDASTDATVELLARWSCQEPCLRVLRNATNNGFVDACNQGAAKAEGDILVFLNNDLVFLPDWLDPLLTTLRHNPKAGAVGGKLILPDGRLQEAGGVVFCDGSALNYARDEAQLDAPYINFLREVDYCSGALLATPKSLFDRLGGFDGRYRPAYYEDVDYCFRVRQAGYRVYYQPASAVVHREGGTSGTDPRQGAKRYQVLNRERFTNTWKTALRRQPVRPMAVDQTALYALALRVPPLKESRSLPRQRRVLVCAAHPPEPDRDSGSRRLLDFLRMLQAADWSVTFFALESLTSSRYVDDLQQCGVAVFSRAQVRLERLLGAGQFALATMHSWNAAESCLPAIRRLSPRTRIIVDSVDLHFLRHARHVFNAARSAETPPRLDTRFGNELARELNAYAAADAVLTVSPREAALLADLIPQPGLIHVLPDLEPFDHSVAPLLQRRGMLFTGSFRHSPNLDALEFLCHEVLPLLPADLLSRHPLTVVGDPADRDLHRLTKDRPHVRLVGWVPAIQPYLQRARLSVVPLRYGAGTKRKLLQSLMAGTPAVSTTIGAEGFEARHEEHLLLADRPEDFARAVERLLRDGRLWHRLSQAGRTHASSSHAPRAVRKCFLKLLRRVQQTPPKKSSSSPADSAPESTRLDVQQYQELQDRIRTHLARFVSPKTKVLVVSRGDEELLKLGDVHASHFPQADNGVFAGYHPADSQAAIEHLRSLTHKGADYLLFPQTAFWWLDYYRDFGNYLMREHTQLQKNDDYTLFRLHRSAEDAPSTGLRPARSKGVRRPAAPPRTRARSASLPIRSARASLPAKPRRQRALAGLTRDARIGPQGGHYDVLCLPIIDWDFRFQRPQQLMTRFAAAGHRVFYLSQRFLQADPSYRIKDLQPNLFEVCLRGPALNVYQQFLDDVSANALLASLRSLRADHAIRDAMVIVQLPFWWPFARGLRRAYGWPIVYDCMDDHTGFETNHAAMLNQEQDLLKHSDLVVVSSPCLEDKARPHNRNVLLLRNGCEYEHFAPIRRRPRTGSPVVGYYGAIAHWFDADLVADLAERRPDWRFILVGATHTADVGRLSALPNISLPGEQPYRSIPQWLARFDVAILPFKRTPLTEATNPVKAYEILAAGKPLISTPLPEMARLGSLVQLAQGAEEFERAIESALRCESKTRAEARRAFAFQNTWQDRFATLASAMRDVVASHLVRARSQAPLAVGAFHGPATGTEPFPKGETALRHRKTL